MFFRKSTQSYYVKLGGKFVPLGRDEQEARKKYRSLVPQPMRMEGDTIGAIIGAYLDYLAANRTNGTFDIAARHLRDFAESVGGLCSAVVVRGFHLQAWGDKRFAGKSASYKNRGMRAVKCCWSWAAAMGIIPTNTLRDVRLPPPGQREAYIPVDQWAKLVAAVRDEPFRDYVTTMLESGLRPQEIHQARVRHYRPESQALIYERVNSKGKKRKRVVPLNPASLAIVERLIAQRTGADAFIFLNRRGRPWTKDSVNCRMRRLRAKLNMPGLCAYTLRHSFAHATLTQGGDPLAVAKAMGHVDTRMIATRYGHLDENVKYLQGGKVLKQNPFLPVVAPPVDTPTPAQ
jgi:integrase